MRSNLVTLFVAVSVDTGSCTRKGQKGWWFLMPDDSHAILIGNARTPVQTRANEVAERVLPT